MANYIDMERLRQKSYPSVGSFEAIQCLPVEISRWSDIVSLEKLHFQSDMSSETDKCNEKNVANVPLPVCYLSSKLYQSDLRDMSASPPCLYQDFESLLFSFEYIGLLLSTVASGIILGILEHAFYPLLAAYLGFHRKEFMAIGHFIQLAGALTFLSGLFSDLYAFSGLHRKPCILMGWMLAYTLVISLLIIVVIDDSAASQLSNFRTYHHGVIYIFLTIGIAWSISVVSITTIAFVVNVSQRQQRQNLIFKFMALREVSRAIGIGSAALILQYDGSVMNIFHSASLKAVLIILAVNALVPIPAVLFRMPEKPRERSGNHRINVTIAQRIRGSYPILHNNVVPKLILLYSCAILFRNYTIDNARDAVFYYADITPKIQLYHVVSSYIYMSVTYLFYRKFLAYFQSRKKLAILSVIASALIALLACAPAILNAFRSSIYVTSILSMQGMFKAILGILVYITVFEDLSFDGYEGFTLGILESSQAFANIAIETLSFKMSENYFYSKSELARTSYQFRVLFLLLGNAAINAFAIIPLYYYFKMQKTGEIDSNDAHRTKKQTIFLIVFLITLVSYIIIVNGIAI